MRRRQLQARGREGHGAYAARQGGRDEEPPGRRLHQEQNRPREVVPLSALAYAPSSCSSAGLALPSPAPRPASTRHAHRRRVPAVSHHTPHHPTHRGIRRGDISLRSESVNRPNLGDCDAKGTALGDWASMKMALGEVESVKEYKMATRSSTKAKAEPRSTRSSTATSTVASTASSQRGARGSRTYVDNAANRKAGRVGKAY